MEKLSETPPRRLQILMTEEELELILQYTHQRKIHGRSAAIRQLVRLGLQAEERAGNFDPHQK